MNANSQDPNSRPLDEALLTAYALGQLEAHEQAAVEAELARSEKARRLVRETAALAGHVYQAQQSAPSLPPSAQLREAVEHRLDQVELEERLMSTEEVPSVSPQPVGRRRTWAALAVAICLLIAAVPIYLISSGAWPLDQTETAAMQPEEEAPFPPTQEVRKDEPSANKNAQALLPDDSAPLPIEPLGVLWDSMPFPPTPPNVPVQFKIGPSSESAGNSNYQTKTGLDWQTGQGPLTLETPHPAIADAFGNSQSCLTMDNLFIHDWMWTKGSSVPGIDALAMQYPSTGMTINGDLGAWTFDSSGTVPATQPKLGTTLAYLSTGNDVVLSTNGEYDPLFASSELPGAPTGALADYSARLPGTPSYDATLTFGAGLPSAGYTVAGISPDGKSLPGGSGYQPADTSGGAPQYFSKAGPIVGGSPGQAPTSLSGGVFSIGGNGPVAFDPGGNAAPDAWGGAHKIYIDGVDESAVTYYGRDATYDAERTWVAPGIPGTEQYEAIRENPFIPAVGEKAVSTFSIDVDTASYANVRRFLNEGRLPPPEAVRIEEMVNYFKYDYPQPAEEVPFSVDMEVAQCPWNGQHRLLRIGLKGREIPREERGPSHLVFLLDVSGSMQDENKLPLVKQAMSMLVEQLTEDDRVSIVTYASGTEVRLPSTGGHDRTRIQNAIDALAAGGSTHGSAGILLAYEQAAEHFVPGGVNRVILATDGDLNVGITDDDELVRLIKEKAKSGVFLTVLGFGTGNIKDAKLEKLADHGNGIYAYVDNFREARKVLVEQLSGSLVTIAKDVKVRIEFNPAEVRSYRLIGYENRVMAARDFANDKKDAGEIGAGHTVTALYEIVPCGDGPAGGEAAGLKYQQAAVSRRNLSEAAASGEMATLKLRYKLPDQRKSTLLEFAVKDSQKRFGEASADFRFATAVATFGMVLRGSRHVGPLTLAAVEEFAAGAIGDDPGGLRTELVGLVRRAKSLGR